MRGAWTTVRAAVACVIVLAAIVGGARAIAAGRQGAGAVSIVGRAYQPTDLTVGLGQTVAWRNESLDRHTVTSVDGLFNSGVMTPGTSFTVTFTKAGTFDYSCTIHPTMKGSVLVLPIAPGTVQLRLTTRRVSRGAAVVVHVLAARASAGLLLQVARSGAAWRTIARAHLDASGEAALTLVRPARGRVRVVIRAADGSPRLVSPVVRVPV